MRYMLMIYGDEAAEAKIPPAEIGPLMGAYQAFTEALRGAGALLDSDRLRPTSDATTVRVVNGETKVLDGPYADTKEQLGGYYCIEAPDLDAALKWAARCPGAKYGTIEVRPVWAM